MFCHQYTANSSTRARLAVQALEREICSLELRLTATLDPVMLGKLQQKRKELSYLNERVKGVLVGSCFTTVADMDAPSAFFFNSERSVAQHKQMLLQGLLQLDSDSRTELDSHLTLQDLTAAVGQEEYKREDKVWWISGPGSWPFISKLPNDYCSME
ncbi:hypothetical protein MHYP_G00087100 [Metynnis hypsauchen]